ncbi:hypothetical protein Lser_V15G35619 [Lactuca serriola]
MEVLLATTKEVKEKNDGFETVVKKNKGNNLNASSKEAAVGNNHKLNQGQYANFSKNGRIGAGNGNRMQGHNGNNSNYGNSGASSGNRFQGQNGIGSKNVRFGIEQGGKIGSNSSQGYNGKNKGGNSYKGVSSHEKGQGSNFKNIKVEQGQKNKNNNFFKKENDAGAVSGNKNKLGIISGNYNIQENKKEEEAMIRAGGDHKYIPNSGGGIKISSNFDRIQQNVKDGNSVNLFSSNKFDVLKDVEDENQFDFSKGVAEADLDYLDTVDQMEVLGGIPEDDTNMEAYSNGLISLIKRNNLSLLAVLEPQVSVSKLKEKCDKVFGSWKWIANKGISGNTIRIIVGWNSNLFDVNLIDQNDQVLHCKISFPNNNKYVFCSFVYAANKYTERKVLWSSLKNHKGFVKDDPWVIGGDFNVILNLNESTAGSSRLTNGMVDFLDCINSLDLQDINCNGLNFTWNQKPRGSNGILKKLDRVMGNSRLIEDFPTIYASFLPYGISDHSPVIIKIPLKMKYKVLPFKFPNVLTLCNELKPLVETHWRNEVNGIKMFQLVQKLKILKKPIRKLFKDQGHLSEKVTHCRKELDAVQVDLDKDPFNPDLRELEAIFLGELNKAHAEEECFLKQKAKVSWLKEGDSNSKYFHKIVKGKINRNSIRAVLNEEGKWVEGENVPNVFIKYFSEFLGTEIPCAVIDNPSSLFSKKLDLVHAADMVKVVTDEEIKSALFDIEDDKAPGPDGFSAKIFKSMWDVIGNDLCQAVKEFFCNGRLLKEVNATVIALVPKIDTPGKVSDYRPISCCSVIYKCISKIIVGRIRDYLRFIVSNNQSAFIPGRSIIDNILLSQELVRGYHRDRGFSRCAMKVDIQKAYDTVNWSFLQDILFFFGFHLVMIKWIMCCVTTPSFMLSINGSFYGYFDGKRGLRQGCPLSPYLFTLVMEVFNLILQRKIRNEKIFKYHWGCKKQKITHLCFADDLMIFCHGNKASVKVIKEALDEFAGVAGLNPNLAKSHIFFGNVKANMKKKILDSLAFVEGKP